MIINGLLGGRAVFVENNLVQSVKIRPLSIDDYKTVLNWSKDDIFCLANGWEKNRSEDELYQWWFRCLNNVSEDFIRMGIEYNERLVGYADLAYIKDNTAELGIAIGESTLWGKGIGFNAAKCIMNFALNQFGISIYNAETHETNIRARKMLDRLGFQEISKIGSEEYLGSESQLIQYMRTL